jgi:hypothetical protein
LHRKSEIQRALVSSADIVDYSLRVWTAYWQSYLAIMKQIALLDPVDFFNAITRGQGFAKQPLSPSWCPDWDVPRLYNPLQLWNLAVGFREKLSSAGQIESIIVGSLIVLLDEPSLFVTGHEVDVVQNVSNPPPITASPLFIRMDITGVKAKYCQRREWREDCFSLANEVLSGSPELVEIVVKTLVAFDSKAAETT